MWNHRSGACLRIFRFKSPPLYSLCVCGGDLYVGAGESCWQINAFTGATGSRYNCRYGAINAVAVCSVTHMLFVASGFVGQMFDLSTGKCLRSVAGHSGKCLLLPVPRCLLAFQFVSGIITSIRYLGGVLYVTHSVYFVHVTGETDTPPVTLTLSLGTRAFPRHKTCNCSCADSQC
jgi:hypothetical protein